MTIKQIALCSVLGFSGLVIGIFSGALIGKGIAIAEIENRVPTASAFQEVGAKAVSAGAFSAPQ